MIKWRVSFKPSSERREAPHRIAAQGGARGILE